MEIIKNDDIKEIQCLNKNKIPKKEDLERLYIIELKSMIAISKIYGCHLNTIRNKLKKYDIPIRLNGAFLIDNDGESLSSKYTKGEISISEYRDKWVKNKGYKNWNDYRFNMNYKDGRYLSMNENKECSYYLGIHIAERVLPLIFDNVERMPHGNPGYDFICIKGYKIDVKSSCLRKNNVWDFHINKNKIADYFLCIAFDNRENLNVMHIWLIKCNAVIEKTNRHDSVNFIFNEKTIITISKGNRALKRWKKYEIIDKLDDVQKVCDEFKNNEKCNLNMLNK